MKQAPYREPDMRLDPGSPGSRPGQKAALNREPLGCPLPLSFVVNLKLKKKKTKPKLLLKNGSLKNKSPKHKVELNRDTINIKNGRQRKE